MKRILLFITMMLFCFCSLAFADIEVTLENTSEDIKNYYFYWENHPYGCYLVYGQLTCKYAWAVGELKPREKKKLLLTGVHGVIGNEFIITWRHSSLNKKENSEEEKNLEFTLDEGLKGIYASPTYLIKKY